MTVDRDCRRERARALSDAIGAALQRWKCEEASLRAVAAAPATRDELAEKVQRAREACASAERRLTDAREACRQACDDLTGKVYARLERHRRQLEAAQVEAAWELLENWGIASADNAAAGDLPAVLARAHAKADELRGAIVATANGLAERAGEPVAMDVSNNGSAHDELDEIWRRIERRETPGRPQRSARQTPPARGLRDSLQALEMRHLTFIIDTLLSPLKTDAVIEQAAGLVGADPLDQLQDMRARDG